MIHVFRSVLMLAFLAPCLLNAQQGKQPDFPGIVKASDLHYFTPVTRSEDGMPTGNGRMGTLVWTIPSALKFQLNRADVFGNNSSSRNFFERHTDYCGGTGALSVDFGTPVFTDDHFSQHLSCYDANVQVKGNGLSAEILTAAVLDILDITIRDNRKLKHPVQIILSTLRKPDMRRGDHRALTKAFRQGRYIILTQRFTEGNYYCASAVAVSASGISRVVEDEQGVIRLCIDPAAQHRVVRQDRCIT